MKNKILINIYVPKLLETYNVYIPVNERIVKIQELLVKAINELSDNSFPLDEQHYLIDSSTGQVFRGGEIVKDTTIRSGKNIILF